MIISLYYPHCGGSEQQAHLLARNLLQKSCSVRVLTRKFRGLPARETIDGVPVVRAIRVIPAKGLFGMTYMLSVLIFLLRARQSFDIIHCHEFSGFHCIVAVAFGKIFNKKVVGRVASSGAGSDFKKIKKSLYGRLCIRAYRSIDRVVTLCSASSEEARLEGFDDAAVRCIPNGVDIDVFRPAGGADAKRETVVFVGRLIESKGVQVLLEAFELLAEERPGARLSVVGDGPMRRRLQRCAAALPCRDRISFHGSCSDVQRFLKAASVFVLPSFVEGLPNALIEAMACGLPVVATRVGGIPDVVDDGRTGILVAPGDRSGVADALKALCGSAHMRAQMGSAARETIVQRYCIEAVARRYIDLYDELLERRGG
jgi:glycosyltransferase involved in cell wall biosynthesis